MHSRRSGRRSTGKPKTGRNAEAAVADPTPTPSAKRNERPQNGADSSPKSKPVFTPDFTYEFDQPNFDVSHVVIQHDESGNGKISFMKRGLEEPESEPIRLTKVTMDKIKAAWRRSNFLDSTEVYQTAEITRIWATFRSPIERKGMNER